MNSARPLQTDFSKTLPAKPFYKFIKRTFDIIISLLALILLSPFFLIIAVCIKAGDKGPALFGHKRIGRNGREFKLYKFRSMVTNAEELIDKFKGLNPQYNVNNLTVIDSLEDYTMKYVVRKLNE